MTPAQIFEEVPALAVELEPAIASVKPHEGGDWECYERCKIVLKKHVGWEARNPKVETAEAYNTMLAYICEMLKL